MAKAASAPRIRSDSNSASGAKERIGVHMVYDKIREVLAEQFEVDVEKITADTDLMSDLGADSLDLVELIMMLEEEYGISVLDDSVYEHKTVGAISDYIESLVKQGDGSSASK